MNQLLICCHLIAGRSRTAREQAKGNQADAGPFDFCHIHSLFFTLGKPGTQETNEATIKIKGAKQMP